MLEKTQIYLKRLSYRIKRDHLTLNNFVFLGAIVISLSWTWSSIEAMQQNYNLQQLVDTKKQQLELEKLRVTTMEMESKYYESFEYQELAVRERLGKGLPGEKLLVVQSTDVPDKIVESSKDEVKKTSNIQEWLNFLFGAQR